MKNHRHTIKWATDCLTSKGYSLTGSPEIVVETPWSNVIRFSTSKEDVYLKETPPLLFIKSKILELLKNQLHASVPIVIASSNDLHCFLLKDAGLSLRKYLKTEFQPGLLHQAIKQYTTIQRLAENHIGALLALGAPDWRLNKLPNLYCQLLNQAELLKSEGITNEELKILHDLSPKIYEQCKLLSEYKIPETLVQPDFNTNNTLFDRIRKKMTIIDLGEIVIAHPLFSLHNFLLQATIHHGVKELGQTYYQLQHTYCENWLELVTKKQLTEIFTLIKKVLPIYSALAQYRLMMSVDLQAFKFYYAHRPIKLAGYLREYAASL